MIIKLVYSLVCHETNLEIIQALPFDSFKDTKNREEHETIKERRKDKGKMHNNYQIITLFIKTYVQALAMRGLHLSSP